MRFVTDAACRQHTWPSSYHCQNAEPFSALPLVALAATYMKHKRICASTCKSVLEHSSTQPMQQEWLASGLEAQS